MLLAVSTAAVIVSITLATILFILWFVGLFLIVVDDISFGAKVLWFFAFLFLAPIAVPAYLILRRRRRHAEGSAAALDH
jgi:hypothetical protein